MSTLNKVFNQLIEAGSVTVRSPSTRHHDNLRTYLCKLFTAHKETMRSIGYSEEIDNLSVCATYSEAAGLSEFRIAQAKKMVGRVDYEIINNASANSK